MTDTTSIIKFLSDELYNYRMEEKKKHDLMVSIQISMIEKGKFEKNTELYNKGVENMTDLSESLIDINAVIDFIKSSLKKKIVSDDGNKKLNSIIEMKLISPVLDAKMKDFYDSMEEETLVKEKEKLNKEMELMLLNKEYDDFTKAKIKYEYIQKAIEFFKDYDSDS
jgi:hypothetical protein